ncbi:Putative uncharacterized protein [Weissella confusa LBAE C39-2]|uniref:hypothetical protein n=1 Tax=Weissella confusa TaxID=1583 RepID=UPI0002465DF0|nr:hypothetical protein [Weissella confusa]CCF31014.1 Putative uncharacterized protein [Weissella confusa LBAE C39-2]
MAEYSTTIKTEMNVSGLDDLKKASAAIRELKEAAQGLSGFSGKVSGNSFNGYSDGAKRATDSLEKLRAMSEKTEAAMKTSTSGGSQFKGQIDDINRATESYKKLESAAKSAANAQKQSASSGAQAAQKQAAEMSKTGQKLKDSFKEATAMFSIGMLGATAVMGLADGVKGMVNGGWETLQDRQRGQAMWATSIQDAHGTSGKALTSASAKANDQILMTALQAGNSFSEANGFAKQIYSSDAGVYSGNVNKTTHMLKGIFNIQDANALSDREMEQFKTAVGNVGDMGKMSGTIAKSFNLLDGKITRRIRAEYKKETGHELGLNKTGTGYDWGAVSAETAYRGIDNYGNSGGIAKASERFNSTLPGVLRSVKEGSKDFVSQVMKTFGTEVAKGGGFSDMLGNVSKAFTSKGLLSNADKFAAKLSGVANALGTGIKEIAPYAKAFGGGTLSGVKDTFAVIKKGIDEIKSVGLSIGKMLPEGSQKKLSDAIGTIGRFVGVALTAGAAFKVLKGGAGLIGDSIKGLSSIIPGLSKARSSSDSVFSKATSVFSSAVGRFTGTSGMNGAGGVGGASANGAGQFNTRSERLAAQAEAKAAGGLFSRLSLKGASLQGLTAAGEAGRLARNTGFFKSTAGKLLSGIGSAGTTVQATKFGGALATATKGLSSVGKFLGKGMPLMNGLFAGVDVMTTMASTKTGSLARHKGVGQGVGTGIGATVGGALGSFLGPLGTIGGSMAGGWLGGKAGSWIGSRFGGTKEPESKATKAQKKASAIAKAQAAAQATKEKQDFASNMQQYGYDKMNANELYSQISKGSKSKSKSKQLSAMRMQEAIENGDADGIRKYQAQLNKQNGIKKGDEDATGRETKKLNDKRWKDARKKNVKLDKDNWRNQNVSKTKKSSGKSKAQKDMDADYKAVQKHQRQMAKVAAQTEKASKKSNSAKKKSSNGSKASSRAAKKSTNDLKKQSKAFNKALDGVGKNSKADKNAKKSLDKVNSTAKSGMNKANKTVKSGSKKIQNSGKDAFKFKTSKSGFNKLNSDAKSGTNKVNKTIKSGSKKIQNSGKNMFKFKSSASGFNKLNSQAKSGMNKVNSTVKSGSRKIQNSEKNAFKFKGAESGFNSLNSQAKSGMNRVNSTIKSGASKWSSTIKSGISKAASSFSSQMSKMVSTASSKASAISSSLAKIGTAAASAASKVKTLQSAINSLKSKTVTITANVKGKGANKLATGTPGAKRAFSQAFVPHYANGTTAGGHRGGMALVNDAGGSNWREAFMLPNGLMGLFPNQRNLNTVLPAGTQVLDGNSTKKLFPRYANGTDGAKNAFAPQKSSSNPTIQINVTIQGNASAADANAIANTIGEKMIAIMPQATI